MLLKKILPLLFTSLLLAQCRNEESASEAPPTAAGDKEEAAAPPAGERDELIDLVYANFKASEEEDLEGAVRILDPNSERYASNRAFTQRLFELYDLDYEIEAIEVLVKTDSTASVDLIQTTRRIDGPAFQDQRIHAVLHFKKVDGAWKIARREVVKTTYLD